MPNFRNILVLLFLTAIAAPLNGQAQTAKCKPGDAIEVRCEKEPALNGTHRISRDGWMFLPVIGQVAAAGKTTDELQKSLTLKFEEAGIFVGQSLKVQMVGTKDMDIRYGGTVKRAGTLSPNHEWKLSDVIKMAEPTESADLEAIRITDATGKTTLVAFDPQIKDPKQDVRLLPGDFVFFPLANVPDSVSVIGAVKQPGVVAYKPGLKVSEAIDGAGGFSGNANRKSVLLERHQKLIDTINTTLGYDAAVKRGDVIRVGIAPNPVFVVASGAVKTPGPIPFERGLTLMKALEASGGASPDAKPDSVVLIRRINGKATRTEYKPTKILASKSTDPLLQPEDVVEVPFKDKRRGG